MTLLLIIILLVLFSLISTLFYKYKKVFICFSILLVFGFYFFLSVNFFNKESFFPSKNIQYNLFCSNYYNLLVDSIKEYKLYISDNINDIKSFYIETNNSTQKLYLIDTSVYKNKVYLYFGITPVIFFYLPFNLITHLYLTDKFLVFILSCFIFLLSLFLIKKVSEQITDINKIPSNIVILCIFLTGCCNLLPFLVIRSTIYEVAITTAVFLLLITFCLFYYYINTKALKTQKILNFCISLTLCLSVGARPHYVLFVVLFFFVIIWLKYNETKKIKDIIYSAFIFFVPCLIYGSLIALYNYIRFDSIFEFGWHYQINHLNLFDYKMTITDFFIGLKNNLFIPPSINGTTLFSLTKTSGHRLGCEFITGTIWTCPIIFILFFIPKFLKTFYKKDINIFVFLLTIILTMIISFIISDIFGMVIRYLFEYLHIMIILSLIIFLFYISKVKDRTLKNFFNYLFILIFVFSLFMNISLLFCEDNFTICSSLQGTCHTKIIQFLF